MGSLTWPVVVLVGILATMITVLILTNHASAVTMATAALVSVAVAIAHAFVVKVARDRVSRRVNERYENVDRADRAGDERKP